MSQRNNRRQELDQLLDTFATQGFNTMMSDCAGLLRSLTDSAATDCTTGELWQERRGGIKMLEQIIMYAQAAINESDSFEDLQFDDEEPLVPKNSLED